ncbi:hypothetical protein JXO52_11265 [bacterium]|nr:hypothetical protein [bacterium]
MKTLFSVIAGVLFLSAISAPVSAQLVAKRADAYILIDTDSGLGGIGDTIPVYRISGGGVVTVGTVRIVRFARGMTAAKVVQETSPGIRKNDFVSTPATRSYIAGMGQSAPGEREGTILLRNRGYALALGDRSLGKPGDLFTVARILDNALLEVGRVRIVKFVDGKAALKIVEEYAPYRISKDDFLQSIPDRAPGDDAMDVDYYYFGAFR